jgi:hypothetical protein
VLIINLARERQIFLWSVIGPLLALATALIMLLHPTALTPFFSLTLLLGLPACWYFKRWSLSTAAFALSFLLFFHASTIANDRLWHIGIAFSILVTLFVTTRSFEEASNDVEELSENSTSVSKRFFEESAAEKERLNFQYQSELHALRSQLENLKIELNSANETSSHYLELAEKAKREVLLSKNDMAEAKMEAENLRAELEAKVIKDEHVLQELLEKRREVFQLRDMLLEVQNEVKEPPAENHAKQHESELQNLQDLVHKKDQELFNVNFRLDSALEDIQKLEKTLVQSQDEEQQLKKMKEELAARIETLKREKEYSELTIHKLQHETEHLIALKQEKDRLENVLNASILELKTARESAMQPPPVEEQLQLIKASDPLLAQESNLRRRAEGMYLQLKEQFNEKSAILDDTRRQLFHSQEIILQWKKSSKEREQFSPDPQVQSLTKYVLRMQNQFERTLKNYQSENETLHEIITKVLSNQ